MDDFQRELVAQNEKHLVAFIVATCIAMVGYIGYDYLSLPALWSQMVWLRLLAVLCGIVVIALFLRKRLSALTAFAIFFVFNSLILCYFVSLYDDLLQFLAASVNLSAAMFILPLALLTYPLRFSLALTAIFVATYVFWNVLKSPFSYAELLIYGGAFNIFAIVVSLLGHMSKIRSVRRIAKLNQVIELKNQEILEQNHKLELQATYDDWYDALGEEKEHWEEYREKLKAEYDFLEDIFGLEAGDKNY